MLIVTGLSHKDKYSHKYWKCYCECGKEVTVHYGNLNNGRSQSCGCARSKPTHDLTGKVFGRWTIVDFSHRDNDSNPFWNAICSCGTVRKVEGSSIFSGKSRSCGCLQRDSVTTHGRSESLIYQVWGGMVGRCHNKKDPSYYRYGGRGITVCDRWRDSFENFLEDMGEKPEGMSIDRINNNSCYCPENTRWATPTEQQRNRNCNKMLTFNGKTQTLAGWAEELNIKYPTLASRIRSGWPLEKALDSYVRPRRQL